MIMADLISLARDHAARIDHGSFRQAAKRKAVWVGEWVKWYVLPDLLKRVVGRHARAKSIQARLVQDAFGSHSDALAKSAERKAHPRLPLV